MCEDSRAIHLELLNSITTEDFLQAFRRMANRRGIADINGPAQKLHLLEEHKKRNAIGVQTSESRRGVQTGRRFPEVQGVGNDCSSFVAQDVQARVQSTHPCKSRSGSVIRPPKRL